MRILYHHRTRAEDAQGVHISEMVKAFRDLGHEVEIVAIVNQEKKGEGSKGKKSWARLPRIIPNWLYELMSLTYNLYGYQRLCQMIMLKKPDMIYERYSLNTFCGILASRRFGIPIVLEVNLPLYYEKSNYGNLTFKRLVRFSERWICSNSTLTVVVTKVMKDLLTREGVPQQKMVVMPNGIDPKKFHPGVSGAEIRRRYCLDGKFVVGFIGWFREWHGLEMLLEIMYEARLANRDVQLLLVGDGPAYRNLYRYAEIHNLLSSVVFTGPVNHDDIPAHIAAMDVAVLSKTNEYGCPMKVIEYMGMGKCILAPDQSTIRELVQNGVNGYLFRPGDQEHFKAVLSNLIQNSVARQGVGKKAYETVHQRGYIWTENARRILDLVFGSTTKTERSF